MVVGLSAAALQGAPVVTEDVDLWFENLNDPNLTRALREVGAAYVPPFGPNPAMLAGSHTEAFDVVILMSGLGHFDEEARHTRNIRIGSVVVKALSLERILASKTAANRPKDLRVLPVLQNVLRTLNVNSSHKPKKRAARSPTHRPKQSHRPERL